MQHTNARGIGVWIEIIVVDRSQHLPTAIALRAEKKDAGLVAVFSAPL
jgi:hypothetical protein